VERILEPESHNIKHKSYTLIISYISNEFQKVLMSLEFCNVKTWKKSHIHFTNSSLHSHQSTGHFVCNALFLWSNQIPEVLMCFKALDRVQREHESWTIFHWQNYFILLVAYWVILPIMTRHLMKQVNFELDLDYFWFVLFKKNVPDM